MSLVLSVKMLTTDNIHPYYRNSKLHSKAQIAEIARSIREFGFDQPIVVDKEYIIIKGHGRYYASLRLKLKQVPVVVREDLSPAQVLAARIADNKVFEMAEIDPQVREEELKSITESLMGDTAEQDFADELPKGKPGPEGSPIAKSSASALPDGQLLVCPKCSHSFMEVPG